MISKRAATALGTGTLGAAGAAGTAAWKWGMSTGTEKVYFQETSAMDNRIIASKEDMKWKVGTSFGKLSVIIRSEATSWECELIGVVAGIDLVSDPVEIKKQGEILIEKIKGDDAKREQFVKNCSKSRTSGEERGGIESEIHLETVSEGNKFKFKESEGYFEGLWTKEFRGVERLEWREEKIADTHIDWKIVEEGDEDHKKITFSVDDEEGNWKCSISPKTKSSKTFKKDNLNNVLKMGNFGRDPIEKKRYLIRNCVKNNREIKGLEIQESNGKWEFKTQDFEKLLTGMYENPAEVKSQSSLPQQ